MGGEWDSTNVADGQVAVFTPIALDHQARLGNTVAEIARTKAGIIKPAASVVTAMQTIEALDELREAAKLDEATMSIEPVDFALESTTVAVGGQVIDVRGRAGRYEGVYLPAVRRPPGAERRGRARGGRDLPGRRHGATRRRRGRRGPRHGHLARPAAADRRRADRAGGCRAQSARRPRPRAALGEYFDFDEWTVGALGARPTRMRAGIIRELAPGRRSRSIATNSHSDRAIPADELGELVAEIAGQDAVVTVAHAERRPRRGARVGARGAASRGAGHRIHHPGRRGDGPRRAEGWK